MLWTQTYNQGEKVNYLLLKLTFDRCKTLRFYSWVGTEANLYGRRRRGLKEAIEKKRLPPALGAAAFFLPRSSLCFLFDLKYIRTLTCRAIYSLYNTKSNLLWGFYLWLSLAFISPFHFFPRYVTNLEILRFLAGCYTRNWCLIGAEEMKGCRAQKFAGNILFTSSVVVISFDTVFARESSFLRNSHQNRTRGARKVT